VSSDNEQSEPPPRLNMLARYGHLEYDRVLFFSDAIFAIAITLLVLDIKLPHASATAEAIRRALPEMVSFGISFVVIGLFWMGHHSLSRYIAGFDRPLIGINLVFLGTIAFLPYPTGLINVGHGGPTTAAVVFYAAWIAAAGLAESAIWVYASYVKGLLVPGTSPGIRRYLTLRLLITPVVFLLSIPLAFYSPGNTPYFWLLLVPAGRALRHFGRPNDGPAESAEGVAEADV
jgi:TMEM175 potassium channel family protein